METTFQLKPNMLLGTVTSATQTDGGDFGHSWNMWYREGRIKDGSNPAEAAGHWDRWRDDVLLMHKMGIQTCRMSIEWARVEPEEGHFDEEAIGHIKEELMLMLGLGIRPLVTLHHFTEPGWFAARGGWTREDNVRCFLIYVEKIIKSIGHLVSEYITIHEPNTYAYYGYVTGSWPPGEKNPAMALNAVSNMASAHIKAYRLIHDMRRSMGFRNSKVSFAVRMRVFTPKTDNPLYKANAAEMEKLFQGLLIRAMATGEFKRPLKNHSRDRQGAYCDFHALDYDTRSLVGLSEGTAKNVQKNDLGWEIYPQGMIECCEKLMAIVPLPIYITSNGTCDLADGFRSRYIYEHLKALCESGLPVKRYYHDCFCDGFRWLGGNYARFGLVHTNFETMERTVKRSGEFYGKLIRARGVTQELYDEYVAETSYHY